jgi:hypothetical protein
MQSYGTKPQSHQHWLPRNRDVIHERLANSIAEVEQGKTITPEEVRSLLEGDRKKRAAHSH